MKSIHIKFVVILLVISHSTAYAQTEDGVRVDTFQFLSVGQSIDTFFCYWYYTGPKTILNSQIRGRKGGGRKTGRNDRFIIDELKWMKIIGRDTFNYLSIEDFDNNVKTKEFLGSERENRVYYEFSPSRKIRKDSIDFYLYKVTQKKNNRELAESDYEPFHIVFNYKYGIIYTDIYKRKKILKGFEKYLDAIKPN